jgi:hypothetical protein
VWVDEAAYVDEEVVQQVILPMIAGVGNRVLVMVSTQGTKTNWFNRLLRQAELPGSQMDAVLFDFLVCTTCRGERLTECEHAKYLTPPWYNPEKAKQVHAIAQRGAMNEMLGLEHDDSRPAFRKEAVEAMIGNVIPVERLSQTIVVGVDPNGGGDSMYGFMAATMINDSLVILGWGIPGVVTDVDTDPNYAPRILCDFLLELFGRYGSGNQLFMCIESNTPWHGNVVERYVMEQPFAPRLTWAHEHTARRRLGIHKDHGLTCRAQQLWHSHMHQGAGVAENPVIFCGGARRDLAGEIDFVTEELTRQFLEYEEVPTKDKKDVTYSGKDNGNDDLVGGAGPQVVAGIKIVQSEMMSERYPGLHFGR